MELFLNIVWSAVALAIVSIWCRSAKSHAPGRKNDRRRQFVALVVLIVILFPVISVSDDIWAVQNASEIDNYIRRDHPLPTDSHPIQPAAFLLPPELSAGLRPVFLRFAAAGLDSLPMPDRPPVAPIDNRPPPSAL